MRLQELSLSCVFNLMQRSGKALQTIADKEEMNFEGSLKYYCALVFWAKFETKKNKEMFRFPLLWKI